MLIARARNQLRRVGDPRSLRLSGANVRGSLVSAALVLITVVIAVLGMERIGHAREALNHLSTDEVDRQVLVERWTHETRLNLLRTVAWLRTRDPYFAGKLDIEMQVTAREIDHTEARLDKLLPEPEAQELLRQVSRFRQQYRIKRLDLIGRTRAGDDVSASIDSQLEPFAHKYLDAQLALNNFIDKQLVESQVTATHTAFEVEWTLAIGAAIAIALGVGLAVVSMRSRTARDLADKRMRHMQLHDPLTGLPNRLELNERLKQAIDKARLENRRVTIALIDLDGFKRINERLGHAIGNKVLQAVGERLVRSIRCGDAAIRLGGDEFALLMCDQFPGDAEIALPLQRIIANIARPTSFDGLQIEVTASIGVATFPRDGCDDEMLLKNAGAAMVEAKAFGGNRLGFYRKELNADSGRRFELQAGLAHAIANGEMFVVYQPQLHLATNRIIGVEALLRWRHPQMGLVSPADFIPVAEQTGLIVAIGEWVLNQACQQARRWRMAGLPRMSVAVNVSARQFRDGGFVSTVSRALSDAGLDGSDLELELTESMLVHDVDAAVSLMNELNALGVRLSIDDFGTGYSSLAALKNFPIARLKVDRSFITNIATDDQDQAITSAIIALGHRLKLKVIAEGIETDEQLQFLRTLACDEIQGYLFSKPLPADELASFVTSFVGSVGSSFAGSFVGSFVGQLVRPLPAASQVGSQAADTSYKNEPCKAAS